MTKHNSKSKSSINHKHKNKALESYDELVIERFKNDQKFLKSCLSKSFSAYIKHNDKNYFAEILSHAIKARGVSHISKETKLSRQTIYEMSTKVDSSSLKNFLKVLKVFNLEIHIS